MEAKTSSAKRTTAKVYDRNSATIRAILLVGAVFLVVFPIVHVVTALFMEGRGIPGFSLGYLIAGGSRAAAGALIRATVFVLIFWSAKDFFFGRWVLYGTVWWVVSMLGVSCMAITGSGGLAESALRTVLSLGVYLSSAYLTQVIYSRTVEARTIASKNIAIERSIPSVEHGVSVEEDPKNVDQKSTRTWNTFVILLGLEVATVFVCLTFIRWSDGAATYFEVPERDHLLIIGALALCLIVFPVFNSVRSNTVRSNNPERFGFNRFVSAALLFLMAFMTNSLLFMNMAEGGEMSIGVVFAPLFLIGFVVVGLLGFLNLFSLVIDFPRRS